jgi:argininosuccinate lyase
VSNENQAAHLWHGRFAEGPADAMMRFTESRNIDRVLAVDDIKGSRAHVKGLAKGGILTADEAASIDSALVQAFEEITAGTFEWKESDEDIHTAVERRVTELAGDAGAKLHTGRSRNDQVATDFRLFCKRELPNIIDALIALQSTLLRRAQEAGNAYLPGYTHLQQAQPVLLAHHLAAHAWALARDVDRLFDTYRRLDVSPLGAGALAGSSLPLDPDFTAKELGFAKRFDNSLDAVSDRDFVAESLFDLALIGVHLSRIGEEIILWSTEEFGFLKLDDAYSTGSSMLPQKKNPDIAELARGKSGRIIGNLTGLLTTLKGLPLAYNRDLQEDKEPLFDALEQIRLGLIAMDGLVASSTFVVERMQASADSPAAAATDLAEWLVQRNVPFRQAHAIVGQLVRRSLEGEGALADLVRADPQLGEEAAQLFAPGVPVTRRTTPGGAGPKPVAQQLDALITTIENEKSRRTELAG